MAGKDLWMVGVYDSDALRIDHSQSESIGLYSEHAPPVEVADRLNASLPHYMAVGINQSAQGTGYS